MSALAPRVERLSAQNPWPGLRAFTEEEHEFFFGRKREAGELLSLVKRGSVVVLYGQSGVGKTSILQAGLFPALKQLDFLPIRLRLDHSDNAPPLPQQIKTALLAGLDRAQVAGPRPRMQDTLWAYFHRLDTDLWGPQNRLLTPVIVFDQFEEVFTLGQKNEVAASRVAELAAQLESVIEHRPPVAVRQQLDANPDEALAYDLQRKAVKFVFSLREDFLPHLVSWHAQMPSLFQCRFRLERMTGGEALDVVLQAGGDIVERTVARDIVDFVSTSQRRRTNRPVELREVEPALLSVVCDELNRRRLDRGQARITADLLTGEREGIIEDFYERAFDGVLAQVRDWVEDKLLTTSGYRQRAALEDAMKAGLSTADFDHLVDQRILHREETDEVVWLEITHDLLSDPAGHSRGVRQQRRDAQAAINREMETKRRLEEAAQREQEARRKLRQSRIMAAVFAVLLLLVLGGAAYAWLMRQAAVAAVKSAIAAENSARTAAGRAQEAENQMRFQTAQDLFSSGNSPTALAYLARVLRKNPGNRWVAERILCALTHRSFSLPASEPLHPGGFVSQTVLSPDGQFVAMVSELTNTWIYGARTGQVIAGPLKHEDPVASVQFSPEGSSVVTATQNGTARLWDAHTGQPRTGPLQHVDPDQPAWMRRITLYLGFSFDGEQVCIAARHTATLWNARTGLLVSGPTKYADSVVAIHFSLSGWRLLTFSPSEQVRIWDASGRLLFRFGSGPSFPEAEFSSDGTLVTTWGKEAKVWDVTTGKLLSQIGKISGGIKTCCFGPDCHRMATVSWDGTARIWNAHTGTPLSDPIRQHASISALNFNPNGDALVAACDDGTARLLNTQSGQPLAEPIPCLTGRGTPRFSPDGQQILTTTSGGAQMWDVRHGQALSRLLDLPARKGSHSVVFSPDGRKVVTCDIGEYVRLWDFATGRLLINSFPMSPEPLVAGNNPISPATPQFSADGRWLAGMSGLAKTIQVWDATSGSPVSPPLRFSNVVTTLAFSPSGDWLLSGTADGSARVWDVRSWVPIMEVVHPDDHLLWNERRCQFSPNAANILTIGGKTARVWDVKSGRLLVETPELKEGIYETSFSPDGKSLLTASTFQTVQLWDCVNARPLTDPFHGMGIHARFSPDGRRIITTVPSDSAAMIWDLHTGKALAGPLRHELNLTCAEFSPDGQRVLTASLDQTARVWDASTGQPLTDPLRHGGAIDAAQFSPDGKWVATAVNGDNDRFWEVPIVMPPVLPWLAELAEAVAGQRINEKGISEAVPVSELFRLRRQLANSQASDTCTRWGQWFFADRSKRTLSPSAGVTFDEHLKRLIEHWTLEDLSEALLLSPTNAPALAGLAQLKLDTEPAPDPVALCDADFYSRRALELAPYLADAWCCRARVLQGIADSTNTFKADERATDVTNAFKAMERAVILSSTNVGVWRSYVYMLERGWDPSRAVELIDGVSQREPNNLDVQGFRGMIKGVALERANRFEEAYQAYSEALNVRGQSQTLAQTREKLLLRRSDLLRRLGRRTESNSDYKKWIETAFPTADQRNVRAWEMVMGPMEKRDPDRGLLLAEEAVRLAPNTAPCLNTLGVAYYRTGDFSKAKETFLESARLNSAAPQYDADADSFWLAMSYYKLGDHSKAKDYYEKGLQSWARHGTHEPDNEQIRTEADKLLGNQLPK
jgi:WD40 repeat protein/tetratricopeptide (TPR) repeat protein